MQNSLIWDCTVCPDLSVWKLRIIIVFFKLHHQLDASSEFGTYRLCEQRRFRRACASAQSRQNLRCSLIQAVSQEEPSDRKPAPWPLWMAGHAQLKFVMTECLKTQIRLTGLSSTCCGVMLSQTSGSCSMPCVTCTMFSKVSRNDLLDITPVGAVVRNWKIQNMSHIMRKPVYAICKQ